VRSVEDPAWWSYVGMLAVLIATAAALALVRNT
jgi:hypothetical protein